MSRKGTEVKAEGTEQVAKVSRSAKVAAELTQISNLGGPFAEAAAKVGKQYADADANMKTARKALSKLRKSAEALFTV